MTEKYQPIPHRLKNMAVGGHVAGARDILDDKKGKNQEVINEETDDSIALLQAAYRALTQSDVIPGELPVTGEANKIYRVPGEDSYTDYMWDGTDFVLMATYDNGVDEEPSDSDNVIKSSGVFKGMEYNDSYLSKLSIVDDEGNIIGYITTDDIFKLFIGIDVPSINGLDFDKYTDFLIPYDTIVDTDDNVIAFKENGTINLIPFTIVEPSIIGEVEILTRTYGIKSDIMSLQKMKSQTREQFIVCTDNHHRIDSLEDIKTLLVYFNLGLGIHLGDYVTRINLDALEFSANTLNTSTVPILCAVGNHDTGETSVCVENCCSAKKLYEMFVKPFENLAGFNHVEDKPYFYYDKGTTRYIVLYDYDDNEAFDETNWAAIEYSPSYNLIETGTEYTAGDKVNVKGYTEHSFEAVQTVTPTALKHNFNRNNTQPCYKAYRGYLWYSSEQLEWLCETLEDATDNDLKVIILKHMPFTSNAEMLENNFTSPYFTTENIHPRDDRYIKKEEDVITEDNRDIVAKIVDAWINGTTINEEIEAQSSYRSQVFDPETSELLRELYDDCSSIPTASINYDFSGMENEPKFMFYLFGHSHADYMIKHNDYGQIGICFNGSLYGNPNLQDVKTFSSNVLIGDKQTVMTFLDDTTIVLSRVGSSKAVHGDELIDKRNTIIKLEEYGNNN